MKPYKDSENRTVITVLQNTGKSLLFSPYTRVAHLTQSALGLV